MNEDARAAQEEAMRAIVADYQSVFGTAQGQRVLKDLFTRVLLTDTRATTRAPEWALYFCALHDVASEICRMLNFTFDQRKPKIGERPRFTSRAHT